MNYIKTSVYIGLYFVLATSAFACSLVEDANRFKTIEENIINEQYTQVLLGTVEQVKELEQGLVNNKGPIYQVKIDTTYRGDLGGRTTLTSAPHSCGSFYRQGDVYLWFLEEDGSYVDELNPQYKFASLEEARSTIAELDLDQQIDIAQDTSWGVQPNQLIQSPHHFEGVTPSGEAWTASDLQVGEARLLDAQGTELAHAMMHVIGNEQEDTGAFEVTFRFDKPATPTGVIVFVSNASLRDEGLADVTIPVVFDSEVLPNVEGPDTNPEDGFVGPTTPPPYSDEESQSQDDNRSWFTQIIDWIKQLFR